MNRILGLRLIGISTKLHRSGPLVRPARPGWGSASLTARLYSPFRGKDSQKRLDDHLGRLPQEFEIEYQRMQEFMEHQYKDRQLKIRAIQKAQDRQHWDNKFTAAEKEFIDNYIGKETFVKVCLLNLYAIDQDVLSELVSSFIALEVLQNLVGCSNLPKDTSREIMQQAVEHVEATRPPIPSVMGFPTNEAVMKKYAEWVDSLKEMESLKRTGTVVGVQFPHTIKSPFGPVSSSACYEELSELQSVHLKKLLEYKFGCLPRTKILLTVRQPAVVSPSRIITTVVEDGSGQLIQMQIHNMKGVEFNSSGLESMPVGARFFLKNPLLKVANDGWLTLRVDQPFDLERLDLPPLHGSILIVGDGDFSFSAALAKRNRDRRGAFIVATSLDSRDTVVERYKKGKSSLDSLLNDPNVKVFHGLDALNLSPLGDTEWDSIVWNFPYPENAKRSVSAKDCNELLTSFLAGIEKCLKREGRLYVTLARGQGGTSNEAAAQFLAWDVETAAAETGMEVVDVIPFQKDEFPGYKPRRAYSDEGFPTGGGMTHILRLQQSLHPGEKASQRTIFSRMSSLIIDNWYGPNEAIINRANIQRQLMPHADTSRTARLLLEASESFESALQGIEMGAQDLDGCAEVVADFCKVFSRPNGELVVQLTGKQLQTAITSTKIVLSSFFRNTGELEGLLNKFDFVKALQKLNGIPGEERIAAQQRVSFQEAILVLMILTSMEEGMSSALKIATTCLSMVPEEPHLLYWHATMLANVNTENEQCGQDTFSKSKVLEIINDCELALAKIQGEEDLLHAELIYLLARMHLYLSITSSASSPPDATIVWKSISLFEEYINLVEPDVRLRASAFYCLGTARCLLFSCTDVKDDLIDSQHKLVRKNYVQGIAAEKDRLPFFGPLICPFKSMLSVFSMPKTTKPRRDKEPSTSPSKAEDDFFHEVRELLMKHPKGIYLGLFKCAYSEAFQKPVPMLGSKSLRVLLESAEASGVCKLEKMAKTGFWVKAIDEERDSGTFFNEVRELVSEHPSGIYLGRFKSVYSEAYQKPVPMLSSSMSLKKLLQSAEAAGFCKLEERGKSELWVKSI